MKLLQEKNEIEIWIEEKEKRLRAERWKENKRIREIDRMQEEQRKEEKRRLEKE